MPGSGGVNRGRGDAEMIWGEETPGRTDQFEAKVLEGAKYLDAEHTAVLGVGAVSPEVDPKAEGSSSVSPVAGADARRAWRRRLAPKHRDAVRQFFSPGGSSR